MNKQINSFNFFNLRNLLLILLSFIFIILSSITLITQRSNNMETLPYLNIYIVISSFFILALVVSISFIVFPIILRVRRKKISTLNSKFTLYFISIALTPAILLGIIGLVLIELGINDWFNDKIKNVINNSVFVAESYLEEHKETIKGDVYAMSNDLNNSSQVLIQDPAKLAIALRTQALIRSLPETYIINKDRDILFKAFDNNISFYEPALSSFDRADSGEMIIMSSTKVNKVYALIKLNNFDQYYLYAGRSMDGNVISALNDTVSAKNEYTFLEISRDKISLIFILLYVMVSLILILISIIIGIKFADRIVKPISSIITATNNISKGLYDDKIKKNNDYIELNRLADSFNKMSGDIIKQRNQIIVSKKYETWSDIARRIAHEIKNPLTPIQLSAERLEKKTMGLTGENKEINECIETIRRQVNEIGYLVDEFSSFARLPDPDLKNNNISAIMSKVVSDYENNNTNIKFINKLHSSRINIKIDNSQISRVFQNLIVNSIHSISESNKNDGEIIYSSCEIDDNIVISLIDNGVGLKYEKEDLIKPYFTTKKKVGGSGLGLAIVEKILFDHHADFILANRNDGEIGAEVKIIFGKTII
ncbi:MAG: HAMP domain-containing protein [Pelagibacteraceae bacterium TMED267]|nr:MAG: HAMP domain-containing protein [Pelagibacteraceae bacterium TMED267]